MLWALCARCCSSLLLFSFPMFCSVVFLCQFREKKRELSRARLVKYNVKKGEGRGERQKEKIRFTLFGLA